MRKQFKCHLVKRMQLIRTAWGVSLKTSDDGGGRGGYLYILLKTCVFITAWSYQW